MHNNNVTLKQKVYSEITGCLRDGSISANFSGDYRSCGKDKLEKIALLQKTALSISKSEITEQDARQIINAIENKKKYLTTNGVFNSLN